MQKIKELQQVACKDTVVFESDAVGEDGTQLVEFWV